MSTAKKARLVAAKSWISTYQGYNVVKGYMKRFKVVRSCALKELAMVGFNPELQSDSYHDEQDENYY